MPKSKHNQTASFPTAAWANSEFASESDVKNPQNRGEALGCVYCADPNPSVETKMKLKS